MNDLEMIEELCAMHNPAHLAPASLECSNEAILTDHFAR
jgi:hypothetical protein